MTLLSYYTEMKETQMKGTEQNGKRGMSIFLKNYLIWNERELWTKESSVFAYSKSFNNLIEEK